MRGVFTSGVLDAFMKYKLYFHYIVAVSAGACNGLSYASRQPRRARISNIDMLAKYDYIACAISLRRDVFLTQIYFIIVSLMSLFLLIMKSISVIVGMGISLRWW